MVCVCVRERVSAHIQVALNDMEVSIENLSKLTKELQEECSKMADILGEGAKLKLDVSPIRPHLQPTWSLAE